MKAFQFCLMALIALCGMEALGSPGTADMPLPSLQSLGVLSIDEGKLKPRKGSLIYTLEYPLFSDHAQKLRTVVLPEGENVRIDSHGRIRFPDGTLISKTFFFRKHGADAACGENGGAVEVLLEAPGSGYDEIDLNDHCILETRVLHKRDGQWFPYAYPWKNQTVLPAAGLIDQTVSVRGWLAGRPVDFRYSIPGVNQCALCHEGDRWQSGMRPLGLDMVKLKHHVRVYGRPVFNAPQDFFSYVADDGKRSHWKTVREGLPAARAYLDVNCGHCHNPRGLAASSALYLDWFESNSTNLGVCKYPVATGRGSTDLLLDISPGKPADSLLVHRMESRVAGEKMPELGRTLADDHGIALISRWIGGMREGCF